MTAIAPLPTGTMKAVVHRRYGSPDVLEYTDVAIPPLDGDGVLVRVRAASINAFDWHVMRGLPYLVRTDAGLRRPKRLIAGVDLAGTVEAVGRNVTTIRPGDEVFGERGGAFAEYVVARPDSLAPKPPAGTFAEAAAAPMAGFTALQAIRDKGGLEAGQRVLVNGAGGGVGTFAVQIAKAFGAHVTAVCHTRSLDVVCAIGADDVIDYTRDDFTRGSSRYDLIIDIGARQSLVACRRVLRPTGALVVVGAPKGNWFAPIRRPLTAAVLSRFGSRRLLPFLAERRQTDLAFLKALIEAGKVRSVIDRTYPLSETAAAMRHVEAGHASGKVVITT